MAIVSHCLKGSTFRRYWGSQVRSCVNMICVTHHVSRLDNALIAEELSHALIVFAAASAFF